MEILKGILVWMWANKNISAYIILALIIAWLSWSNNRKTVAIEELNNKNQTLSDNLKLRIDGTKVVYRDRDKIVVKYMPKEGGITVALPDKNGFTEVKIKNKGFTFKPGFGAYYTGKFDGALDFKVGYWDRYSLGLGSTLDSPLLWSSRHIDDLVPFLKPENIELSLGYGKPYANFSNSVFLVGLRTNF